MAVISISITIPWFALPLVLNGHATIYTIPPGSTVLSAKEPRPTSDGIMVEFAYDDGEPVLFTVGVAPRWERISPKNINLDLYPDILVVEMTAEEIRREIENDRAEDK